MQKLLFAFLIFPGCICGCSYGQRVFNISETENPAAWSRANVGMFKNIGYEFTTVNDYIIYEPKTRFYITREKVGPQWVYTVSYYGPDSYEDFAIFLENYIKNIQKPEEKKSDADKKVDSSQIKLQEGDRAKRRVLPNGRIIWE